MNKKYKPFILSLVLLIVDQLVKTWVVKTIPLNTIHGKYLNDFLWIVHVRNTGIAFSVGDGLSIAIRIILFIIVPIGLMLLLSWSILSKKNFFKSAQKWYVAGIIGGGLGTICDRIFRFSTGVVDFISVKFYGLLGMERWPTFNISDSCVVVFTILLLISILFMKSDKKEGEKQSE